MRKRWLFLVAITLGALHGISCGHMVYAQSHPDAVEVRVGPGTWFFALQAFNAGGLFSGYSNEVRLACTPAAGETTCLVRLMWDRNSETDLAGYRLGWGVATGAYVQTQTIPVDLSGGGTRLPTPTLRIRR